MKYLTKEWYELCQRTGLHFGMRVHNDANIYDEALYLRLYTRKEKAFALDYTNYFTYINLNNDKSKIAKRGHNKQKRDDLRWMMDNIYIRTDPSGKIKPDKEKSTEKIDGAVATIMALDRATHCGGTSDSVYDNRGLLII
ncbi:MAG: hypothetical protein PHN55_11115 [Dysgonamonadaceae bacterium]|nr:hypothetical protein [Dysgonamonadaceae bacterium]